MAILDKYSLKFKGLSSGTHHFEYTVDDDFWSSFEGSEIVRGDVKVEVDALKQPSMLTLDFRMNGGVEVPCDRCLGEFRLPVEYEGRLLVKFAEDPPESDGDILWIHPTDSEVDLSRYIYESILLSLPFQRIHPDDENGNPTCDPEMLKRFRIVSLDEFEEMFPEDAAEGPNENQGEWEKQLASIREKMEQEEKTTETEK